MCTQLVACDIINFMAMSAICCDVRDYRSSLSKATDGGCHAGWSSLSKATDDGCHGNR